jgi:HNH endonuclease
VRVYTSTPPRERFERRVDRSGGPDACHPWTGGTSDTGYGTFHPVDGTVVLTHRYAWEQEHGPIPEGAHVDHTCHNGTGCPGGPSCPHRRCCNVRHLEPTTGPDNVDRSHNARQRRTHCPSGHAYTPENTYHPPGRRHRMCRACRSGHRKDTHA